MGLLGCCRGSGDHNEGGAGAEPMVFFANFDDVPRGVSKTMSVRSRSSSGTVRSRRMSIRGPRRRFFPMYDPPRLRKSSQKGGYFNEPLPNTDTLSEIDRKRMKVTLTKWAGRKGKGKGEWERKMITEEKRDVLAAIEKWDKKNPRSLPFDHTMTAPLFRLRDGAELNVETNSYRLDAWIKEDNVTPAADIVTDAELDFYKTEWTSLTTLVYLQYAIRYAHRIDGLKDVALHLLSRINYYHWGKTTPISEHDIIEHLRSQSKSLSDKLKRMTSAHRKHHQLQQTLGQIKFTQLPKGLLTQKDHIAFMESAHADHVLHATGTVHAQNADLTYMAMLQILAEYLAPLFDKHTKSFGGAQGKAEASLHKTSVVKTWSNMYVKRTTDDMKKKRRRLPTSQYNKDLISKTITSHNAAEQVSILNEIKQEFEVVGYKNSFEKFETKRNDVVVTVAYSPTNDGGGGDGGALTFGDILDDKKGFQVAVDTAKSKTDKYNARWFDYATKAYQLILPAILETPVKLLVEFRLVLQFYHKCNELQSFYETITEAKTLHALRTTLTPKTGDHPRCKHLEVQMSRQTLRL